MEIDIKKQTNLLIIISGCLGLLMLAGLIFANFGNKGTFSALTCPSGYTLSGTRCMRNLYYDKGYKAGDGNSCYLRVVVNPSCSTCSSSYEATNHCNGVAANYNGSHTCNCTYASEDKEWYCWFDDTISECMVDATSTTPTCDSGYPSATACEQEARGKCTNGYTGCVTATNGCYSYTCNSAPTTSEYTVTFNNATDEYWLFDCKTDNSGKVDSYCVSNASSWCGSWSTDKYTGSGSQTHNIISSSNLSTKTFTGNATYYCVSGTSIHEPGTPPTQTCSNDKLSTASKCKETASAACGDAGYTGCTTTDSNACYSYTCKTKTCSNDKLSTASKCKETASAACGDASYIGCTKTDSNACYTYTCLSPSCPVGHFESLSECQNHIATMPVPNDGTWYTCEADGHDCYEIEAHKPEWHFSPKCFACQKDGKDQYVVAENITEAAEKTGGTNCFATTLSTSACVNPEVPENPKTGTIEIFIAWVVGIMAMGYAVWYFIKINAIKEQ